MFHLDKEPDGLLIQEYLRMATKSNFTPHVYVRGKLIGGLEETARAFGEGEIKRLLAMPNMTPYEKKFNELLKQNEILIFANSMPDSYKVCHFTKKKCLFSSTNSNTLSYI